MGVLLGIVFIGLIIPEIVSALFPDRKPEGGVILSLMGISGALLGVLAGEQLGFYKITQPSCLLMATVGSIALIAVCETVCNNRDSTHIL